MHNTIEELKCIKKRIKSIRFKKGLTQENMADMLQISQNSYHKLENGRCRMSLQKFIDISKILEIEPQELIYGPEKKYTFSKYYKSPLIIKY
tara:strand:- start:76 stop:351 length:276 start_codon:yes stop_codon:yes gene_type:complete